MRNKEKRESSVANTTLVDSTLHHFVVCKLVREGSEFILKDGATGNTANNSKTLLHNIFRDRITNRHLWPAISPDMCGDVRKTTFVNTQRKDD
jgi:hypothetical protein